MATQTFSEKQIIEMARQEETSLIRKKAGLQRLKEAQREINSAVNSLEELKANKEKILVSLGAGVLIEAEAKETKKCLRRFSEGGFIEEKVPETLKWLREKKKGIKNQVGLTKQDIAKSEGKLSDLISLINQIEAEKRKNFSRK